MLRLRSALSACIAVAFLHAGCVRSVPSPSPAPESGELARIAEWEDRRSLGGGRLLELASGAGGEAARIRALRALARIQDVTTLDTVLAGLTAAEPRVRGEAAFAAGQLALSWEPLPDDVKLKLTEALLAAEAKESDLAVRLTLLESLSKVATPLAVEGLTARLTDPSDAVAGRAALSLGVAARRGASVAGVPLGPVGALVSPERTVEARYGGAYLLAVARRPVTLDYLRRCIHDPEPDVRALCAKGFGDVGGPEDAFVLGRLLEDKESRVAAEAARTLVRLSNLCMGPCTATDALLALDARAGRVAAGESSSAQPLLAVAQGSLPPFGRPVLESLRRAVREAFSKATSETAARDLAWLDCRFSAAMVRQTGTLEEVLRCGGRKVDVARRLALGLRELAQSKASGGASDAVVYLQHPDARVRAAALEAVGARPVPQAMEQVRALMGGEDLVIAGSAAAVAGTLKDAQALPAVRALAERVPQEPDLAAPVASALVELMGKDAEPVLRPWLTHPHANVRRVAAESLTTLTGQPVRSARVELPADTYRPQPVPSGASLTFRTRKGDITVALDEDAPLTSGNLYGLAKKGYFRDVTFHRVVPDFVAQGGDPRGDGEGGPGYSIRCEMTRRPYHRGTLGMALSGPDTGGSQFFFTHSPQPHLDGRYTAFGEVTAGMEVVDALLEGDVILEVVATP